MTGLPKLHMQNEASELTDDWSTYYAITAGNIVVFGVVSGSLLGILLTRAITRAIGKDHTPMLDLDIGYKSYKLSKAILYIIVVLDTTTDLPTIIITLVRQTYRKNTAYAINM